MSKNSPNSPNPHDQNTIPDHSPRKYTPTDWSNPSLAQLNQAITLLKTLPSPRIPALISSLKQNSSYYQITPFKNSTPTYSPSPPVEWWNLVDYSNPHHIREIISRYSDLRASDKESVEWVDWLVENAPLLGYERHIVMRRVDGWKNVAIGVEVAQVFGVNMDPAKVSSVMGRVYKLVAKMDGGLAEGPAGSIAEGPASSSTKSPTGEKMVVCKTCERNTRVRWIRKGECEWCRRGVERPHAAC